MTLSDAFLVLLFNFVCMTDIYIYIYFNRFYRSELPAFIDYLAGKKLKYVDSEYSVKY